MAVDFRLLGGIEAWVDGRPVAIGYPKLRSMLAVLLVTTNHTVTVDDLVERVWGEQRVQRRPRAAVQHGIALLRRALGTVPGVASPGRPATSSRPTREPLTCTGFTS
jgi:DNA-binding SARP family transcriptional activator